MFDEFVQTSRQPSGGRLGNGSSVNGIQGYEIGDQSYDRSALTRASEEGAEQESKKGADQFEGDHALAKDPVVAVETGFISNGAGGHAGNSGEGAEPIFQLGRVQYAFPAPLALLTVQSNIMTMCLFAHPGNNLSGTPSTAATSAPKLVRINLDDPERTEEADVPLPPVPRNRGGGGPVGQQGMYNDPSTIGPHRMYADPTGKHLLLSMKTGDNFYWISGWKKARLLPKLKGMVIESVAWNKLNSSSNATGPGASGNASTITTHEVLLGTRNGEVWETIITANAPGKGDDGEGDFLDRLARRTAGAAKNFADVDKVLRHVYTLPERQPITGLHAEPFPSSTGSGSSKLVVLATTCTRIYEFVGTITSSSSSNRRAGGDNNPTSQGGNDASSNDGLIYERFFQAYRNGDASPNLKSELPGDMLYSELHVWAPNLRRSAKTLAWLTGPGVYHGVLHFADQRPGDSVIDSANLLPYPAVALDDGSGKNAGQAVAEIPLSIALTQFHFLLLYRDRIMGISSLDDQLIYEEGIPLKPGERVISTAYDSARHTCWVYTDGSIFELIIKDEDQNVWKTYLQRGAYDMALSYAKTGVQRQIVLAAQGDRFFRDARYIQAAQCYAQTRTRTFEEIVLKFVDVGERDALRYFLVARLERTAKGELTQRMMLATWLVEIYLSRINQLEDIAASQAASEDIENYKLEKSMLEEELKQFFVTYQENLDRRTMFRLIAQHGRSDILLHYADVVKEYDVIVRHWLATEQWEEATKVLGKQSDPELYYKTASILIKKAPKEAVDAWIKEPRLQPRRLMPAILQHRPASGQANEALRYLLHVVQKQGNTDSAIHNLIVTLLAKEDSDRLLDFVERSGGQGGGSLGGQILFGGQPCYDLDYALRTCLANGKRSACVKIYTMMGLYADAVDLALSGEEEDLEAACVAAEQADGDDLQRKKIWLMIAKYVVEAKKDIKAAMSIIERSGLLSIEDVLPYFPDFVIIDDFKDQICDALESYASRIENLKAEMDEASKSAQSIKEDIDKLSSRFVTVDPQQKCDICDEKLLERQFYVFPCRHSFHAHCLIAETTAHLPRRTLRRILYLQEQLSSMTDGLIPALPPSYASVVRENAPPPQIESTGTLKGSISKSASAAGGLGFDRLREIILPDAVVSAISQGVSVSVAGGRRVLAPLDPFAEPTAGALRIPTFGLSTPSDRRNSADNEAGGLTGVSVEDEEKIEELRDELDSLVASSCVLCEGALAMISRPFVSEKEKAHDEWAL